MQKREIIILSLTLAAALYAVVEFLIPAKEPTSLSSASASADLNMLTTQLAALSANNSNEVMELGKKLQTPWPEEVFFNQPREALFAESEKEVKAENELQEIQSGQQFVYSGFLQMANEKIAIINGTDYKLGDTIGPYTVGPISKEKVVIMLGEATFDIPIKLIDQ